MRIAIFTDTYPPEINGVATSCKSLRDILLKHGHEVMVVTTNPFSKKVTFEDNVVRIPGIKLKKLYGYRMAGTYSSKAIQYVYKFKPDVIHIQTDFGISIFGRNCASKLHCALMYTYHTMYEDYTYYFSKGHFDRVFKAMARGMSSSVIKSSNGFITPSKKTKDYLRRIGIDSYANVIPTGIDFTKFNKENISEEKLSELKKKFGIKKDEFILLSLGRVAKEKSVDFSIDAFNQFIVDHPDVKTRMVIVGGGPDLENLQEYVKEKGIADKVIFTGACPPSEVQYYYALGNAFVSASLSETQGLTYMEAMASKLFVLARYDHNLLDVIKDGQTGFFFETKEEFSIKLYEVYNLHKKNETKLLENALKSIDSYSIETFYERVIGAYKHAIKQCW